MARRRPRLFLPQLLLEHFEELEFLLSQRAVLTTSPDHFVADVVDMDYRIGNHVRGLHLAGETLGTVLKEHLMADDFSVASAAAYVLLSLQDQAAADLVMDTLVEAQGEQVEGLRQALSQGPLDLVGKRLKELYDSGPPRLAAVAAEVFASHGRLRVSSGRLREFYEDEDIEVRRAAWRITALVGTEDKP